jgi:hypothetical protein
MVHNEIDWDLRSHYVDSEKNVVRTTLCRHCEEFHLWHLEAMVFPVRGLAPQPIPEMPQEVRDYYDEAATISTYSPQICGCAPPTRDLTYLHASRWFRSEHQ